MLELIFRLDLALIMQVEKENQLEQDVFQNGQNEPSPEVIWRVYPACEVDQTLVLLSLSRTLYMLTRANVFHRLTVDS